MFQTAEQNGGKSVGQGPFGALMWHSCTKWFGAISASVIFRAGGFGVVTLDLPDGRGQEKDALQASGLCGSS